MSGTSRRNKLYEALPAPVVAYMIDRRLLTGWPLEATQRGLVYLQRAPAENVHRRAMAGDPTAFDTYLIKGIGDAQSLPRPTAADPDAAGVRTMAATEGKGPVAGTG